jgi:hypothetical protein
VLSGVKPPCSARLCWLLTLASSFWSGGAVDLRRVQVVDGGGVVAGGDLVGGVLVGEGGVQAGLVGDVEDGVGLQELVGVDDLAGGGVVESGFLTNLGILNL